jgi:hypothetical protein
MWVCARALHSAVLSGKQETSEANERFTEATRVLSRYWERSYHLGVRKRARHNPTTDCPSSKPSISVYEIMENAKQRDGERINKERFGVARLGRRLGHSLLLRRSGESGGPTTKIKFVFPGSLLDPAPLIIHRERRFIELPFMISFIRQRNSVPTRPFPKSFGTLAVSKALHISASGKILTFTLTSPQMGVSTSLHFSFTHFRT